MDRKSHPKHHPTLTPSRPYVDQYMAGTPRFSGHIPYPQLNTGITRPVYHINGDINFSLPLEEYPPRHGYHREIIQMKLEGN